jgi:branched-chain amino acid aminotransferase
MTDDDTDRAPVAMSSESAAPTSSIATLDPATSTDRSACASVLPLAWLDGEIVDVESATIPVWSAAAISGVSAFEGIRAYWNAKCRQLYVFRAVDHLRRLKESECALGVETPWGLDRLRTAVVETLRANEVREDVHLQVASFALGSGLGALAPTRTSIVVRRRDHVTGPLRCRVSSWRKTSDDAFPQRVKAGGNYLPNRLAALEARRDRYDVAIMLNARGTIAEAPTASVFLVRAAHLTTPQVTNGILDGITRRTILEGIAPVCLQLRATERDIDRAELYTADEVFLCGTGVGITPVSTVDGLPVGRGGVEATTRRLMQSYFAVVSGHDERFEEWRTPVYDVGLQTRHA